MAHLDPAFAAPDASTGAPLDARALIERQIAVLGRLTDIGMEIAEACGREAVATGAEPSREHRHDPGLAFARIARAVRMTIALQSRLLKDLADLDRADVEAAAARKSRRRMRLRLLVERAAEAEVAARREAVPLGPNEAWDQAEIEEEIERLSQAAYERLTDAEDWDLSGRPFAEVVAGICGDLGLSAEWSARLAAAVEAAPGSSDGDRLGMPSCWRTSEGQGRAEPGGRSEKVDSAAPPRPPP